MAENEINSGLNSAPLPSKWQPQPGLPLGTARKGPWMKGHAPRLSLLCCAVFQPIAILVSSKQIQNQPRQARKEALGEHWGSPGPGVGQGLQGLFSSSLSVHNLEGTSSPILLKGVGNLIPNAQQELTTPFLTWESPGEHSQHVLEPITACKGRHPRVIPAITIPCCWDSVLLQQQCLAGDS